MNELVMASVITKIEDRQKVFSLFQYSSLMKVYVACDMRAPILLLKSGILVSIIHASCSAGRVWTHGSGSTWFWD